MIHKVYGGKANCYSFYIKTIKGINKSIGWIDDRVFLKEINYNHKFNKANAWGIDYDLIPILDEMKCHKLILRYGSRRFTVSYKTFKDKGYKYPNDNNRVAKGRFQPQLMLAEKFWQIKESGEIIQEEYKEQPKQSKNLELI